MNHVQAKSFFRDPKPEELQDHVDYFHEVIEENADHAPYDLVAPKELDNLIRRQR